LAVAAEREWLRLYFDTCALHSLALVQPWVEGWSPNLSVSHLGRRLHDDFLALWDMFRVLQITPQELVFSELTEDEVLHLPQRHPEDTDSAAYMYELIDWVQQTFGASALSVTGREREIDKLITKHGLEVLPDVTDRVHLALAIHADCDYFITVDYKTIIAHRNAIRECQLKVVRPVEYCFGKSGQS